MCSSALLLDSPSGALIFPNRFVACRSVQFYSGIAGDSMAALFEPSFGLRVRNMKRASAERDGGKRLKVDFKAVVQACWYANRHFWAWFFLVPVLGIVPLGVHLVSVSTNVVPKTPKDCITVMAAALQEHVWEAVFADIALYAFILATAAIADDLGDIAAQQNSGPMRSFFIAASVFSVILYTFSVLKQITDQPVVYSFLKFSSVAVLVGLSCAYLGYKLHGSYQLGVRDREAAHRRAIPKPGTTGEVS